MSSQDETPVLQSAGSADSHAVAYRPDIDGLRAIAVLSVIFYHLSTSTVAGGFLGVDMFFVLSGFLITSIIWREAQLHRYSIARFYERRVRRILPALLLVLAFTTLFSALVLLPADLIGYGKSLLATMAFVANLYFWRDTNYFARAAEYKPLLHMWSLGVEEQFYIFFPLLLAFLVRFHSRVALYVTAGLAILSFAANMFMNYIGGASPAFFLLPTRAWELGIGAVLALLPTQTIPRRNVEVQAWVGIALVAAGIILPRTVPWFVPEGTLVVLGTALLIYTGRAASLPMVNRVLSWRPVVFIGLISYSLYLWHWPVFVLLRYYFVDGVSPLVWIGALVFIGLAATASWYFIERPYRSKAMPIRNVLLSAGSGAVALAAVAVAIVSNHGLPHRFSAQSAVINRAIGTEYRCDVSQMIALGISRACPLNLPSRNPAQAQAVLLGNSHAQMYAPAWKTVFEEHHVKGLLVPLNGCLPMVSANESRPCVGAAQRNLVSVLSLQRVRTVIVAFTWWHSTLTDGAGRVLNNRDNSALIAAIDDLDQRLVHAGKRVILVGPIVLPGWDVPTTLSRELAFGLPVDKKLYMPEPYFMRQFGSAIRHFESQKDVVFVPAYQAQCRNGRCYYVIDGRSLYADDNHLSVLELWRFQPLFESAYRQSNGIIGLSNRH
jgi:peptidoglycan/LPS O-acetylase OafA/YrhL